MEIGTQVVNNDDYYKAFGARFEGEIIEQIGFDDGFPVWKIKTKKWMPSHYEPGTGKGAILVAWKEGDEMVNREITINEEWLVEKQEKNERPCQCGSGQSWVECKANTGFCR